VLVLPGRVRAPGLDGGEALHGLALVADRGVNRETLEAVIVGFTAPRRSRPYFGALALAVREKGAWRYIGHVGTGFSHAMLEELHGKLWPLRTAKSPFHHPVKDESATTWVKPKLVAEVKFTEWTVGGEMRHPAFLGLREDKKPVDVVLEKEEHPST
jgi:bifunctional non-homologous end joining protein LigD